MYDLSDATKIVADKVGMSWSPNREGWDSEVVVLAATVGYTKTDIRQKPERVAREITRYLDDLVKNP